MLNGGIMSWVYRTYNFPNTARHTFSSQLLTTGIAKQWVIRQLGHTSTRMIYEHHGKWICAQHGAVCAGEIESF